MKTYELAQEAGLVFVHDTDEGIKTVTSKKGVKYILPNGETLKDKTRIREINLLVIPPAWKNVWICNNVNGYLQAIGWDVKGRKQYRYHSKWNSYRSLTKFGKLSKFIKVLPKIQEKIEKDLKIKELIKEKVLATVIKIMEMTYIRVGNDIYEKQNKSYGLTTLKDKHAKISGKKIIFDFKGKSGVEHEIELINNKLARIVKNCQDLPGQSLFQCVDHKKVIHHVTSTDVNKYINDTTGESYTAKDFRTWGGTKNAIYEFERVGLYSSESEAKKNIISVVKKVASLLGNKPATCRKYYIHPEVINTYLTKKLLIFFDKYKEIKEKDPSEFYNLIIDEISNS